MPGMLIAFGVGLMYASYMVRALSICPALSGTVSAVLGCSLMLGAFLTSVIIAHLHTVNQMSIAIIVFIFSSCTLLLQFYLTKIKK